MSQNKVEITQVRGSGASIGRKAWRFESWVKSQKAKGKLKDSVLSSDIESTIETKIVIPVNAPEPDTIVEEVETLDLGYSEEELKKKTKNDLGDILNGMDVEFDLTIKKAELIKLIIDNQ